MKIIVGNKVFNDNNCIGLRKELLGISKTNVTIMEFRNEVRKVSKITIIDNEGKKKQKVFHSETKRWWNIINNVEDQRKLESELFS